MKMMLDETLNSLLGQKEVNLQDIEFGFINGRKIWLSAATFDVKKNQIFTASDDILIIFEEPIAYKYKVGNYTSDENFYIESYKKGLSR